MIHEYMLQDDIYVCLRLHTEHVDCPDSEHGDVIDLREVLLHLELGHLGGDVEHRRRVSLVH